MSDMYIFCFTVNQIKSLPIFIFGAFYDAALCLWKCIITIVSFTGQKATHNKYTIESRQTFHLLIYTKYFIQSTTFVAEQIQYGRQTHHILHISFRPSRGRVRNSLKILRVRKSNNTFFLAPQFEILNVRKYMKICICRKTLCNTRIAAHFIFKHKFQ